MSSTGNAKIRTRCPACRSKYSVPATFVGHHARCTRCRTRFVVQERNHHPTEADILRWLNEGSEEQESARSPRVVTRIPHTAITGIADPSPPNGPADEVLTSASPQA